MASGMALVANLLFLMALLMQREELKLQRIELRATRLEMQQSRDVAERQESHLRAQVEIAEKTAVITRIMEFAKVRDEVRESRMKAGASWSASSEDERAMKSKARRIEDAWWAQRIDGVDRLLSSLLQQDCLDELERESIRAAAGLLEPPVK